MLRGPILAALFIALPHAHAGQTLSALHVKVVLLDARQQPTPVSRHALLVSDNPPTAPPRRILTAVDGTAEIRLRPGLYTVESDRAVAFEGRAYQWTQMIEIGAGRDATLVLTADNAEVTSVAPASTASGAPPEDDPSFLLPRWQDSVVALWTPTIRATGFIVDAGGLLVSSQRAIGDRTEVEVQLGPAVKVAGHVLAADPARDVVVIRIDPAVAATVPPVPLDCTRRARAALIDGQEVFAIGAPLRGSKSLASGTVVRAGPQTLLVGLRLATGSLGGPVFGADGRPVGLISLEDEADEKNGGARGERTRLVGSDAACQVLQAAQTRAGAAPPDATRLPTEPLRPFPFDAVEDEPRRGASSAAPYRLSSSDFDFAFITPVLLREARRRRDPAAGDHTNGASLTEAAQEMTRLLTDFGNWSEYVADIPPVLLVRVTPKLAEGFWARVARGAAYTQGMALPPLKRFKAGFSRMRAFCGTSEVRPIHPFVLEHRIAEHDAIREGLYVFDPGALGPHCGTVAFVVYAEKEPAKGDRRLVDASLIEQVWRDFEPLRRASP